jgi:hypothetical protein
MITIICLPLTFVSGYFVRRALTPSPSNALLTARKGMNFDIEPWKEDWSDILFWCVLFNSPAVIASLSAHRIIALPCVAVISPLFIIPDIKRMIHYIQRRKLLTVTAKVRTFDLLNRNT